MFPTPCPVGEVRVCRQDGSPVLEIWLVVRGKAWPPSMDLAAIGFVVGAEGTAESGLLVGQHEEVGGDEEEAGISEKWPRPIEESGAGEGESSADVHGIAHETVRAANYQVARRIEGHGSAFADGCESEDAPQRDDRARGSENHSRNLRDSDDWGADNSRPRQDTGRQVDEQKTDKERRVSDGTDKNKHD